MHIFFAGTNGAEIVFPELKNHVRKRLASYYHFTASVKKLHFEEDWTEIFLLDSGAFTAWSKKANIDLDTYSKFCVENLESIDYVVNLDVIPAQPRVKKIPRQEIERSAKLGWDNAQHMLQAGIPVEKLIHVFHQNEDFSWLKKMLDKFEYIGLSPANDRTTSEKIMWLDQCMQYVTDSKGKPIIKFHGFAVTSHTLMTRYPWFSVDSASWSLSAAMGSIMLPTWNLKNGWDYSKRCHMLCVSSTSPNASEKGKHIESMPLRVQQLVRNYAEECNVDADLVKTCYYTRALMNAQYINKFSTTLIPWPDRKYQKSSQAVGFGF